MAAPRMKHKIGEEGGFMVEAEIPFALNVGSETLPSGNYEVRNVFANALLIQTADTHEAAIHRIRPR